jgi:acyl-CoA thioesterase FadM
VSQSLRHDVTVPLRWRDIDMLGHLNQSVYHELLEEARAGLITELVRRVGAERIHGGLVVRHVDLDYHHEVRKDDGEVRVAAWVLRVGDTSIHLGQEVRLLDGRSPRRGRRCSSAGIPRRAANGGSQGSSARPWGPTRRSEPGFDAHLLHSGPWDLGAAFCARWPRSAS